MRLPSSLTLVLIGIVSLLAAEKKYPPISHNGKPLSFEVTQCDVTKDPQSWGHTEILLSPGQFNQGIAQGTIRGPLQATNTYEPITLNPSDSFVMLGFKILNVKRRLALNPSEDVQLIDAKGSVHLALGTRSVFAVIQGRLDVWVPFSPQIVDPKLPNAFTYMFQVPTDAVPGASIRFQDALYPLTKSSK
jgi:hypothetical protein